MRTFLKDLSLLLLVVLVAVAMGVTILFVKLMDTVWIHNREYVQVRRGWASWYAGGGFVCASRQYPLKSWVKVTYGHVPIVVQVTSRGPAWRYFQRGRIVDLSRTSFSWLAPLDRGLIPVTVEACPAPVASPR